MFQSIRRKFWLAWINGPLSGCRYFKIKNRFLNYIPGFQIGKNCSFVGGNGTFCTVSILDIGPSTWIGTDFKCHGNGGVFIGENCDIAPDVTILTGTHKIGNQLRRAGEGQSKDVHIGSGTWICSRVLILPGITIGKSCVLAAGSIICKNIPDNSFVVGYSIIKRTLKDNPD